MTVTRLLDVNVLLALLWKDHAGPVRWACSALIGSKQTTDGNVVASAYRHGGKLATLDRGTPELVRNKRAPDVVDLVELPPWNVRLDEAPAAPPA